MTLNVGTLCPPIVVAEGAGVRVSNIIPKEAYSDAGFIVLYGPAILEAHTYTIEVTYADEPDVNSVWSVLCLDGDFVAANTPVGVPGALQAKMYKSLAGVGGFRIASNGDIVDSDQATWNWTRKWHA